MFAALENVDDDVDINGAWETVGGNAIILVKQSLGHHELKMKQAKMQWLQDPSQINGDDLNILGHEAVKH
jgi:hypothetical protein